VLFERGVGQEARLGVGHVELLADHGGGHQAVHVAHGERAQQHRIDHAENGGVNPDAKGERQDCDRCHARVAQQHPDAVAKVP
jgi:hypothetical protein